MRNLDDESFDSIFRTESVFKSQKTLAQAWVPERDQKLLCRDDVIKKLLSIHRPIIEAKGNFSTNTLVLGSGGVGKTLTIKYFGSRFRDNALKREVNILAEYYDCLQHRTKSSILRGIADHLHSMSGGHGYSDNELIQQILDSARRQDKYLFIILDEIHNLSSEDILALLNASIGFGEHNSRFSIICISRTSDWYKVNNEKITSRIQETVRLEPYNKTEALEILKYRRNLAFRDGVLEDPEVEFIADMVVEDRNMRMGIDVMRACGLHCDEHNLSHITSEMILDSRSEINSTFRADIVDQLKLHEHLTLAAVGVTLTQKKEPFTGVDEAYINYCALCEEFNKKPHVKMSFRKYIRNLVSIKALSAEYLNPTPEKKGRQLRIKLLDINSEKLVEMLRKIIPNEKDTEPEFVEEQDIEDE